MIIFIFSTFAFLFLGFYHRYRSRLSRREAFLLASVVWGLLLVLATELLSAFQYLSFPYVAGFWLVMTLVTFCFFVFSSADPQKITKNFQEKLITFDSVLLSAIVLILFLVAVTAWMAPPNNWDSLVYHMSRVAHWQQNHSIVPYLTNIKKQIYFSPFAEWMILHFQILTASDRLANFVQWFAMLGSAVAVSLLAKFFGARMSAQIFSALFAVTIPMGIVQGSSTQNDYVLTFWLVVFVYFGLRWTRDGQMLLALASGGALGLSILTKGLACIFALPFLIWFLFAGIKKWRFKMIASFIVVIIVVVAVNVNHLWRNFELTGNVLGEEEVYAMTTNDRMNPALFISNVSRNVGLHLATSIKPLNRLFEKGIEGLHHLLNVSSSEPATTLGAERLHISVSTHEDGAGNFCQLVLIIAAIFIFLVQRKTANPELRYYLLAILGGVALFNLLLKWAPSASRLHLPFFVLFAPFVAVMLFSLKERKMIIVSVISAILLATAVPYVFRNSTRKIFSSKKTVFVIPRLEQYFANDDTPFLPYQRAVDFVLSQNCHDVGLRFADNCWEYAFWVIFQQPGRPKVRLEHVDVEGIKPANHPLGEFKPCAIIDTGRVSPPGEKLNLAGQSFSKRWEQSPVKIYLPQ